MLPLRWRAARFRSSPPRKRGATVTVTMPTIDRATISSSRLNPCSVEVPAFQVRIIALATRLSIRAQRQQLIVAFAVRPWTSILEGMAPCVYRHLGKGSAFPVPAGNDPDGGLMHQRVQSLFSRGIRARI